MNAPNRTRVLSISTVLLLALPAVAAADCEELPLGRSGAYQCAKPADTPATYREGPIQWQYYDQAIFGDETGAYADPANEALAAFMDSRAGDADVVLEGVADYHRTLRVDKEGRQWLVRQVDWSALDDRVWRYDESTDESDEPDDSSTIGSEDGPDDYDVPIAWSDGTCSSGTVDWALWDADDRVTLTGPNLTDRQKTEVLTVSGTGGLGCSGTIVSTTHVLTAAHCVTGPSGGAHNPANTSVFAGGNAAYSNFEAAGANAIVLDGPPWNGNVSTDYALIEVDTNLKDTNGKMFLSQASNSTINNNVIRNLGFPAMQATASSCNSTSLMVRQSGWSDSVTTAQVRTELDGVSGHSGGAVYYCPTGDDSTCSAGQSAYIISLMTTIHYGGGGNVTDVRGPRVKNFRTWALGII